MMGISSKRWWIGGVGFAAVILCWIIFRTQPAKPVSFPVDGDVIRMTAALSGKVWGDQAIPEFEIPATYFPRLLAVFRPAIQNNYPAVWDDPAIGTLKIKNRMGEEFVVRFGFSGKNVLCYNFNGVRCIRGGPYKPTQIFEQ